MDHAHVISKRIDYDIALLTSQSWPAAIRYVDNDEAGHGMYETKLTVNIPDLVKWKMTVRGEALWHIVVNVSWNDEFNVQEVEVTQAYLNGGIVRVEKAHLAHESNDAKPSEYDFYKVTKARWDGWVWTGGQAVIVFPAGTGHTPPAHSSTSAIKVAVAATLIGVLRVEPVKDVEDMLDDDESLVDWEVVAGNAQLHNQPESGQ